MELKEGNQHGRELGMFTAWVPYLLVALLLVVTRQASLPFVAFSPVAMVKSASFTVSDIFGTKISEEIFPLYLPGTVFLIVSLATYLIHRIPTKDYAIAWSDAGRTIVIASVALIFTVPMVQVFINSAGGEAGYDKMPIALATGVKNLVGEAWPLFSTFIGGIGAAVAGSNTVSNMMFSLFQYDVGQKIGVDPIWIVALQAVGGAGGKHDLRAQCGGGIGRGRPGGQGRHGHSPDVDRVHLLRPPARRDRLRDCVARHQGSAQRGNCDRYRHRGTCRGGHRRGSQQSQEHGDLILATSFLLPRGGSTIKGRVSAPWVLAVKHFWGSASWMKPCAAVDSWDAIHYQRCPALAAAECHVLRYIGGIKWRGRPS